MEDESTIEFFYFHFNFVHSLLGTFYMHSMVSTLSVFDVHLGDCEIRDLYFHESHQVLEYEKQDQLWITFFDRNVSTYITLVWHKGIKRKLRVWMKFAYNNQRMEFANNFCLAGILF